MKTLLKGKRYIAIIAISFVLLAIGMVGDMVMFRDLLEENLPSMTNIPTPTPVPTITQEIIRQTDLSNIMVCQIPDEDMYYGGIGGSEDNPPNGTSTNDNLTKYYNMPTATGICGTYWHIAGWWFNQSEMKKLPSQSIMYKISPYAITDGDGNVQMPVAPIPERPSIVLVLSGVFMIIILSRYNKR